MNERETSFMTVADTSSVSGALKAASWKDLLPAPRSAHSRVKVLIADDDAVTLELLTGLLSSWEYEPVPVRTGREAFDLLSAQNGPSLAVLDWMLPDLLG